MQTRRQIRFVVLGLFVVLTTMLGVTCVCTHGHAMRPAAATAVSAAPADRTDDRACATPAHEQCGAQSAVNTPTIASHPQPLGLPARMYESPTPGPAAITRYMAAPRVPNLHVLEVLRT